MGVNFRFQVKRLRAMGATVTTLCAGVFLGHTACGFEPPRPLVVVFAGGQAGSSSKNTKGLGAAPAGSDALTPSERSLRAAQAVRERLDDAGVFTTALYNPDAALFLRAMQEGKIHLSRSDAPTDKERRALGKAAGAVYVIWVGAAQANPTEAGVSNSPNSSIEIELQGIDVQSGSGYSDRSRTQAGAFSDAPSRLDSNAVPNARGVLSQQNNVLLSAANTLTARLLAGPLREFARPAPPSNLLPPPVPLPAADSSAALAANGDVLAQAASDAQNSAAALDEAEGRMGSGNTGAAIVLLRRSISLYPTNLYLRAALTRAYGQKMRWDEAASEARRALTFVPVPEEKAASTTQAKYAQTRQELTRLFSEALEKNNDVNAARQSYEQIIAATPNTKASAWARIAYADLLLRQNKPAEAQTQIKAVQAIDAQNAEAPALLARFYAGQGDYKAALAALSSVGAAAPVETRSRAAASMFDEGAVRLADTLAQNRTAWETGKITREGMYKATRAQAIRAGLLADLIKSAPSSAPAKSPENKAYLRRVHAASVLVQAVSSLINLLDSGDRDAGDEATLLLGEFRKEINAAQNAAVPPVINR